VGQSTLRQDHKQTTIGPLSKSRDITMRYSSQVKPISYLKANAAEVLAQLAAQRQPLVITQNGEAKAVLQDVASFEQTQETLALLKVLALGNQDVAAGKVKPASDVITRLRSRLMATKFDLISDEPQHALHKPVRAELVEAFPLSLSKGPPQSTLRHGAFDKLSPCSGRTG
jgi:prevent-host-death family protein